MAARCASCSYPLSVEDSVSCLECSSHFHIDCAQLVGFPYYELSSDPLRNTFHCQTCKILPLPRPSDSDSDSEDYTMPSRQLDFHLEGQPDFAKDMNELKGTVQDLSELCKDMFREIGELKSINLTLRCGIENIRHDSEQQNRVISDLRKRIEALEGRKLDSFKPIETDTYVDRVSVLEEDVERFLTPDPEYSILKGVENVQIAETLNINENEIQPLENDIQSLENEPVLTFNSNETNSNGQPKQSDDYINVEHTCANTTTNEDRYHDEENMHFADQEKISKSEEESNETDLVNPVQDWEWKGNKAIHLKELKNVSSEEEEECETEHVTSKEHCWEVLEDDLKTVVVSEPCVREALEEGSGINEESEIDVEGKRVTWADEDYANEQETEEEEEEEEQTIEEHFTSGTEYTTESVQEQETEEVEEEQQHIEESFSSDTEYTTESFQEHSESKIKSFQIEDTEEKEEKDTDDEVTESADRTSLKSIKSIRSLNEEEAVDKPKLEEEIKISEGDAEIEGRADSGEMSRLEGGEEEIPEGEMREGGQSPDQGEVQPSELSEGSEPPPPQPQHTPDDLWDYLKESVTGDHPATVEEFVQKLIGTLEHVPEEYLKPVIDYNIKRATSPSVTDGEHLDAKEGDHHEGEGQVSVGAGEAGAEGSGETEVLAGDEEQSSTLQESPVAEGELSEDPPIFHEDPTNITEEPTEGYTALEDAD
ncbi:FK506-binding protein 5-like isoform X2 [Macrosteles quadrilineatus]|uniref:FK506-binding protein 5-like isoform X2 n=1 Tax=Macrosteles quadrilineatus TaxID=74068 RepID=UPI0023E16EBA|nr:FK506-binding protein 5-like isoform X2 [Macrosteles quadrilineatus]